MVHGRAMKSQTIHGRQMIEVIDILSCQTVARPVTGNHRLPGRIGRATQRRDKSQTSDQHVFVAILIR